MSAVMSFSKPRRRLRWHSSCLSTARGVRGKCVTPARRPSAYRGANHNMTFCNPDTAYCLHIVKRRDTARKSILPAKTEPEAEKSWQTKNLKLTFQNASSLYWQAWFSHAEVQESQLCTLTLTILHPHFDYLAPSLWLSCTPIKSILHRFSGLFLP